MAGIACRRSEQLGKIKINNVLRTILGSLCALAIAGCSLSSDDEIAPKELKLVIEGPSAAAPGVATGGFSARLTEGNNEAIEEAFVSLKADEGTINAPENLSGTDGAETDGTGQINFAFLPPGDITESRTIKITAKAELGNRTVDAVYSVAVTPDTFQFIEPTNGSSSVIGVQNAIPLQLQWTRREGNRSVGVGSNVQLTSDGGFFVINGSALPPGEAVVLATDGDKAGAFPTPVAIASSERGLVTVSASDEEVAERRTEVIVQFLDQPATIVLDADALSVEASPASARFSNLTARVQNARSEPVAGIEITFSLLKAISSNVNERVSPSGGVTNNDGTAASRYEAGPINGAAVIQACVSGGVICNSREIKVVNGVDSPVGPGSVPSSVVLDAVPASVTKFPSASRFSTVTTRVSNAAGQPLANVQLVFALTTKAGTSVNERLLPASALTAADGTAIFQYEAGPDVGAAVVQACVRSTTVCGARQITVSE